MHKTRLLTIGHTTYWQLVRARGWLFLLALTAVGAALGAVAAAD